MPVPPLDKNWKPPENPNNPPLPRDWKPPENPNNPPLPRDWKPSTPLGTAPPAGYTPAYGSSRSSSGGSSQMPTTTNGGITDGYYTGTSIKAWNASDNQAFRQGLGLSLGQQQSQSFPQSLSQTTQQSQTDGGPLPPLKQMPSAPQPQGQPRPDQFWMGMQGPGGTQGQSGQQGGMQAAPNQQQPWNPLMPSSPTNMPPQMTPEQVDAYRQDLQGGRFGASDRAAGMHQGYTENAYQESYKQLEKARQSVMVDPRFSPEQRKQALERIAARADELDQGYLAAKPFESSPIGFDAPPPEQYAEVQAGTNLQPMQNGSFRNPDTGDIMQGVVAPNGERIPVPASQSEMDALPDGTRYLNAQTGKIETAGGTGKSSGQGAASQTSRTGGKQTAEDAYAEFEKWNKSADFSREEKVALDRVLQTMPPGDVRDQILATAQSDPVAAREALDQAGVDTSSVDDARIQAFARERAAKGERTKKVAEAIGIKQAPQAKQAYDPTRYRTEVGTRGTMQIKRRGSDIAIPAMIGPDGSPRPAPVQPKQLADLEVDTEFVNIVPKENGYELRMLPFSKQMVNLQNFALTDAQRKVFAKEGGRINARPAEEWSKFEDVLQKYQAIDEVWDPKNPTAKQRELRNLVSDFYGELGSEGKALMTMYIAHSLGYRIDANRGFTSTGFARDPSKAPVVPEGSSQQVPTAKGPTVKRYDNIIKTMAKNAFTYVSDQAQAISQEDTGGFLLPSEFGARAPEYYKQLYDAVDNMMSMAKESGQPVGEAIDSYIQEVMDDTSIPKKKRVVLVNDLRKQVQSMLGSGPAAPVDTSSMRGSGQFQDIGFGKAERSF